jgi:predicted transcriptional regulator
VNQEGPSPELLAFIDRFIESIEQLEILLFLFESDQDCSAYDIFQHIQSSHASVEMRLSQLQSAGFIARDSENRYRFNRNDQVRQKTIADLAACYRAMRVRIIEAIYTRKTDAVRTFADAFNLKRKE